MKRPLLVILLIGLLVFFGLMPQINELAGHLQTFDQQLNTVTLRTQQLNSKKPFSSLTPFRANLEKALTQNQIKYQLTLNQDTLFCRIMTLQVGPIVSLLESITDSSEVMISKLDIIAQNNCYQVDILFSN